MKYPLSRIAPRTLPTVGALAAGLCCANLQAQEPGTPQQLQRVEITGSNIKRLASETASPVQVISREDIRQTGASTVRQVLDTLTGSYGNELRDDGGSTGFAAGASGVSMRGLGKGATLVLLNGRRVAAFGLADGAQEMFVNVDSIPADAIERIETLKDGASAIYGSDAMAGVINIITRRGYQGLGLSASKTFNTDPSAGGQHTLSLVGGWGDLDKDRFNVFSNVELYKRQGFTVADVKGDYPAWHKAYVANAFGDPSVYAFPGNYVRSGKSGTEFAAVPGCKTLNSQGLCVADINGLNPVSDPAERLNLFSAARLKLSDTLEGFAELSYSKTKTEYRSLPFTIAAGQPWRWYDGYNKKTQLVNPPEWRLGDAAYPAQFNGRPNDGSPVGINYRFLDDSAMWGAPSEADQYRVLTGLKGVYRDMDWEVALGRVGAKADKYSPWAHRDLVSAVQSGEYKLGGPNSPELLERLFPRNGTSGRNHQNFIDAKLSGELMELAGGPLSFALGAEHRQEAVSIRSSDNVMRAEIIGRGALLVDGKRNLDAAFLELNAPVLKRLELNGALRLDKATGFKAHVSPKLGLRYEVSPQLLLRGTVAGGFRAPNIPETLGEVGVTGFFNRMVDPRRCETATDISNVLKTGTAQDVSDAATAFNSGCLAGMPAMISANPQLKPETSRSLTLGFVFEPSRALSLAMDYYRIERRDEIGFRDVSYVLGREGKPGYEGAISRGEISAQDQRLAARANQLQPGANFAWGAGQVSSLLLSYENLGKTLSSGIDLDVKGRVGNPEFGSLTLGLATTYALSYRPWDMEAGRWRPNQVGLRNKPRLKSVLSANWSREAWSAGLRLTISSATKLYGDEVEQKDWSEAACLKRLKPVDVPCFVDSDLRTDVSVAYSGFKNLRLSLNINNLTGADNPVNLRDGYKLRPRTLKLGAEYSF